MRGEDEWGRDCDVLWRDGETVRGDTRLLKRYWQDEQQVNGKISTLPSSIKPQQNEQQINGKSSAYHLTVTLSLTTGPQQN